MKTLTLDGIESLRWRNSLTTLATLIFQSIVGTATWILLTTSCVGVWHSERGFVIRWKNSEVSKRKLAYPETVGQLEKRLASRHPTAREGVAKDLEAAKRQEGATVFDWLVEIIEVHCPGGLEAEDGVELILQ